jgi:hypothetical protein
MNAVAMMTPLPKNFVKRKTLSGILSIRKRFDIMGKNTPIC